MKKAEREKLVARLRKIAEESNGQHCDIEGLHEEADEILCQLIDNPEITNIFHFICKWYA